MDEYEVDAIIFPSANGTTGQSQGYANRISAYSGYPAITVAMGFADSAIDATSHSGTPMGLEFLAEPYAEEKLIGFAYAYEQVSQKRAWAPFFPNLTPTG